MYNWYTPPLHDSSEWFQQNNIFLHVQKHFLPKIVCYECMSILQLNIALKKCKYWIQGGGGGGGNQSKDLTLDTTILIPGGRFSLVALVLDMSRTCPGLVPTVPVLGQNTVFMGTQDRLQNVSHGSVTCPSCPAIRLCQSQTKNKRASHGPKITVADQK